MLVISTYQYCFIYYSLFLVRWWWVCVLHVDILWLIILLASGLFLGMLTAVVHVTYLNCLHVFSSSLTAC